MALLMAPSYTSAAFERGDMTWIAEWLGAADRAVGRYAGARSPVLRWGLGLTILLAGGYKLVAPAAWHAYLAPTLEAAWPTGILSLDAGFVLFGLSEIAVGLLLLADWHTPTVAALTAISLAATVGNLALAVAQGMAVIDVLIRDLGLTAFATGVALDAAQDRSGNRDADGPPPDVDTPGRDADAATGAGPPS